MSLFTVSAIIANESKGSNNTVTIYLTKLVVIPKKNAQNEILN